FGIAVHHLRQVRSAQRRLEQLEHGALAREIGGMGAEDNALHRQRRPSTLAVSGDQLAESALPLDMGEINRHPGLFNEPPANLSPQRLRGVERVEQLHLE